MQFAIRCFKGRFERNIRNPCSAKTRNCAKDTSHNLYAVNSVLVKRNERASLWPRDMRVVKDIIGPRAVIGYSPAKRGANLRGTFEKLRCRHNWFIKHDI